MFGMMFGDVGHGAVLAMVGLAALLTRKWLDAGLLLLVCGLSSAVFGVVYGSWFGLARFRSLALWRDPLEADPIRFMSIAIGLGVVAISLGLVLNVLNRLRHRDVLGALMDRFGLAGLLFYWGALAFLLWQRQRGALPAAAPAILILPVAAWVLEKPIQRALHHRGDDSPDPRGTGLTGALVEAFETILAFLAEKKGPGPGWSSSPATWWPSCWRGSSLRSRPFASSTTSSSASSSPARGDPSSPFA
jgi:V/A-type H+-transporting ATPase subunit I